MNIAGLLSQGITGMYGDYKVTWKEREEKGVY